jgi:hypothetical protein
LKIVSDAEEEVDDAGGGGSVRSGCSTPCKELRSSAHHAWSATRGLSFRVEAINKLGLGTEGLLRLDSNDRSLALPSGESIPVDKVPLDGMMSLSHVSVCTLLPRFPSRLRFRGHQSCC